MVSPHDSELWSNFPFPKQTVEGQDSSSTGVVQGSVGQLPEHYVPTSTVAPPHEGGRVTQDDPSVGTRVPNLSAGGHPDINSQAGNAGKPLPSTQGGVNTQLKSPATNILSLHCRMCDAPPMATTQPTVTTCGHLFCSEYVPKILGGANHRLTPRQVYNGTRGIYV